MHHSTTIQLYFDRPFILKLIKWTHRHIKSKLKYRNYFIINLHCSVEYSNDIVSKTSTASTAQFEVGVYSSYNYLRKLVHKLLVSLSQAHN